MAAWMIKRSLVYSAADPGRLAQAGVTIVVHREAGIRCWAVAVFVLAIVLAPMLVSCAQSHRGGTESASGSGWTKMPELTYLNDFPVEPQMTERIAQAKTVEHLSETIRKLPAVWSLTIGDHWQGEPSNHARRLDKCTFDKEVPHAPHGLWIDYHLYGSSDPLAEYLPALRSIWKSLGWTLMENVANPGVVKATTPDHFALTAAQTQGTGETMITTTSPCLLEVTRSSVEA
ncbi:hypothetical protein NOVA_14540 [Nocardia nova]|uniref:hypothetical protein n=1 Tax=Nocardia nova TaxID=37330 RepID=UPI001C48F48D|nr:hypothetical protein [Nocardia nova]MBV7703994.1 hypothetical protein [Nocardia nova]